MITFTAPLHIVSIQLRCADLDQFQCCVLPQNKALPSCAADVGPWWRVLLLLLPYCKVEEATPRLLESVESTPAGCQPCSTVVPASGTTVVQGLLSPYRLTCMSA